MIIYGWGYFNRRDHSVIRTSCQGCGRRGHMASYTSSKFFTLYFIPLIPLGTQKIIAECPHCKQARGMSLCTWKKLRQTEVPVALAEYEANPTSEEAAKKVLGAIISMHDRAALRRVGPQIRTEFDQNAKILAFLAGTYDYLCLDPDADEAYLAAMSRSDDAEIAAEANAHMELQKLPKPRPPNRLLQSLPVLIVPAALVFALSLFVQRAATARVEDGFVMSGLDRAYSAVINGRTVTLAPFERVPAPMLVYGKNEIAPAADSPFLAASTFEINTPWYQRAFSGPLVVVNPDQAAVLIWESSGYAYPTAPEGAYHYRFATNRVCHVFDDIDFPFRAFPPTVEVPENGSVVYKQRISDASSFTPGRVVAVLLGEEQREDALGYIRARVKGELENVQLIYLASALLPREEFVALAETRLATRPVLIEWHRAYQGVVEGKPEGRDLVARYREFVAREPENSALNYLLARAVTDLDEADAIMRRAAALPNPTGYAAYGLAYRHMLDGEFKQALAMYDQALLLEPQNTQFARMRVAALYGARDFATAEREAGNLLNASDVTPEMIYEHLYRLGCIGRAADARNEISQFVEKLALPAERFAATTAYLESAIALATRDRAAFRAAAKRGNDTSWNLSRALVEGELAEAQQLMQANPADIGVLERLTMYVLLQRAGHADEAAAELETAIGLMSDGSADHQRWAGWLQGDAAPDARLATHTCEEFDNHGVYLTALAAKFPARADEYLRRAAALKHKETVHTLALELPATH